MGSLVQQHSTTGDGSGNSQTETFAAAVAGNQLIVVATSNENAGVSDINTPSGYTLLGQFRQGTTHVNVAVFGKIAAGGETSVTVTASATGQRLQTWFGEFNGYTLTLDGAISTAGATSGTAGDTGTKTPSTAGHLWLGVLSVKNSPASGLTGSGAGTAATVNNEAPGTLTSQKVMLGVWYDLARSTAARQQPTWTTTSAAWAGLGLLLQPGGAPVVDATITVNRGSVLLAATKLELHALHVQQSVRGRENGSGSHNATALTKAITACNDIYLGHANHIGWPAGSGWQQMDPMPYGGYTVGSQVAGSTLNIDVGANFPTASGSLIAKVYNTRAGTVFSFTGKTSNQLTGCSGLPATIPAGSPVVIYSLTNNGIGVGGSDRPLVNDNNQSYSVKELFDQMTGTTRTLLFHGAPVWTHGQANMNNAPRAPYILAYAYACAELVAQFAAAGTPITHVSVWNEMKSFGGGDPLTGQAGATGVLQSGGTGVWQPADAGAVTAVTNNYLTAGYQMIHYTLMYNAIWDAIKNHTNSAVNTVKVLGPHLALGGTNNANDHAYPFGSTPGTLQASGFINGSIVPSNYDRNRLCYFCDYATGFDGLTLDLSIVEYSANADDDANETYVYAHKDAHRHVIKQVKSVLANRSGLSAAKRTAAIHFIEYYVDTNLGRVSFQVDTVPSGIGGFTDLQQGYMEGLILRAFLEEGASFAYKWQPMGDGNWNKASIFLTTQQANGTITRDPQAVVGIASPATQPGDTLPAFDTCKIFADNFPPGTTLYTTTSDDGAGNIWAVASATKTIIANGYSTAKDVDAEGATWSVPGYSYLAVDAASAGLVAGTFTSTGSGTSTLSRSARRKATLASTGSGTSGFVGNIRRGGRVFASTGSGTSAFILTGGRQLVQSSSALWDGTETTTETFNPARAGNALILVVSTNENAGIDTVATPAGWLRLAEFAPGGDVRIVVFGMVAAGGETSVTVVTSVGGPAYQRTQTALLELAGVSLNAEDISTANSTSLVTVGDTGTVTPSGARRCFIGVVSVKNRDQPLVEGGGFLPITVNNETSGNTSQALTLGVWYSLDRSTPAREQPSWSNIAARYAGLGLLLLPDDPTVAFTFASAGVGTSTFTSSTLSGTREMVGAVPI